jgi:L-seryl-tRNA(Ser) seleniumtransferase
MLLDSSESEIKKRETALKIINAKISRGGRKAVFDLSGLSGGYLLKEEDLNSVETYIGPALFTDRLEYLGIGHLGGEKIIPFNRTTVGILSAILTLVKPGDEIIHYLPKLPSHPAAPRSARLVGASYKEYDRLDEFTISDKTALVMITGSTMDHDIIRQEDFLNVVKVARTKNIPVFVDDASGARLRTILYEQPKALDMGADIVITSTYKQMKGPRGGIMSGKKDLINKIKLKAYELGFEAQPPVIAGMVKALEEFKPEKLLDAFHKKSVIYKVLRKNLEGIKETPTGIVFPAESIMKELNDKGIRTSLSNTDVAFIYAMLLLINYNIITISAAGMPGCSPSLRIDFASIDAERMEDDNIVNALCGSFADLCKIVYDDDACKKLIFNGKPEEMYSVI